MQSIAFFPRLLLAKGFLNIPWGNYFRKNLFSADEK